MHRRLIYLLVTLLIVGGYCIDAGRRTPAPARSASVVDRAGAPTLPPDAP